MSTEEPVREKEGARDAGGRRKGRSREKLWETREPGEPSPPVLRHPQSRRFCVCRRRFSKAKWHLHQDLDGAVESRHLPELSKHLLGAPTPATRLLTPPPSPRPTQSLSTVPVCPLPQSIIPKGAPGHHPWSRRPRVPPTCIVPTGAVCSGPQTPAGQPAGALPLPQSQGGSRPQGHVRSQPSDHTGHTSQQDLCPPVIPAVRMAKRQPRGGVLPLI